MVMWLIETKKSQDLETKKVWVIESVGLRQEHKIFKGGRKSKQRNKEVSVCESKEVRKCGFKKVRE